MGGAARNARKKRQSQTANRGSSAVAAARRGDNDRKKVVIGVVVVVVLLGAVIAGVVVYNNNKNTTEGKDIQAATSTSAQADAAVKPDYPVSVDGGVVVVGQPAAKVTLDVYEDFLCPACRQFESTYGDKIESHLQKGDVAVRYHMLPMLNEKSDPPGYSMDSANAGLCVANADPKLFPAFHKSLFEDQPEEGSRGWDRQQLADLGKRLGITESGFASCVLGGTHNDQVQANFDQVQNAPYLQQDFGGGQKGFGTPTIAVGQKVVDTSKADWLDQLVKSAA